MKKNNNENVTENVATIENLNESNENVEATETQPTPNTTNYDVTINTTDKFVDDVISCLGEFSYSETNQIISFVQSSRVNVPINLINEILSRIASFPWKAVNGLMANIANKQDEYFVINNPNA